MNKPTNQRQIPASSPPGVQFPRLNGVAKSILLVGVLAIGLLVLALLINRLPAYEPEVTGGASLRVDTDTVDFGQVQYSKPVEAVFTITNVGDAPLVLLRDPTVELVEGC